MTRGAFALKILFHSLALAERSDRNDDVRALQKERFRRLPADAAARARDNRNFSRQIVALAHLERGSSLAHPELSCRLSRA